MRHAKPRKSNDDLDTVRGIGLAVVLGFVLWVATIVVVGVATRSPSLDTLASYSSLCSEVGDDRVTSGCDSFRTP